MSHLPSRTGQSASLESGTACFQSGASRSRSSTIVHLYCLPARCALVTLCKGSVRIYGKSISADPPTRSSRQIRRSMRLCVHAYSLPSEIYTEELVKPSVVRLEEFL
jgi:hypothetical protein